MREEIRNRYNEILKKQQRLLADYFELLNEEGDISLPPLLPGWPRHLFIESQCPLSNRSSDSLGLLVAPGGRDAGIKEIRDFTKNSEKLIIIDPYIFSGKSSQAKKIAEDFARTARLAENTPKNIRVIYNPEKVTKEVKRAIEKSAKEYGVTLTSIGTEEIHDRIWISDRSRGLVVGTSLSGLGKRVAFLLDLPKADLDAILDFLDERKLSRNR